MSKKILILLLGNLTPLVFLASAFARPTLPTYILLLSASGRHPTGILLLNPGQEDTDLTLKAFNEQGDLLKQISVELGPSESKSFLLDPAHGGLPVETAAIEVESDVPVTRFIVFGSEEAPLAILPVSPDLSQTFEFSFVDRDDNSWTAHAFFNPSAFLVSLTFLAFDKEGGLLAEAPVTPLSPRETRTILLEQLFHKSLLPSVTTVRAIADAPLVVKESKSAEPLAVTPICSSFGREIGASYSIWYNQRCGSGFTVQGSSGTTCTNLLGCTCVGTSPIGGSQCLGRCGGGCDQFFGSVGQGGAFVYTQQCLNHDLCVASGNDFPVSIGACSDEFAAAIDDWLASSNCTVTGLIATPRSPNQIDLAWIDNFGELGFAIERKTGSSGSWSQVAKVGANTRNYSNTGLTPNTLYYYRVRAYIQTAPSGPGDCALCSGYSNEASATTPNTVPAAPSNLVATAVSSSQINLSWRDNATNESETRLERKTGSSGTWGQITSLGANATSYNNIGLSPNLTYCYRVRACNSAGCSGYSNEACVSTPRTFSEGMINGHRSVFLKGAEYE